MVLATECRLYSGTASIPANSLPSKSLTEGFGFMQLSLSPQWFLGTLTLRKSTMQVVCVLHWVCLIFSYDLEKLMD